MDKYHKRPFDSRWESREDITKNDRVKLTYRPRSGEKFGRLTIVKSDWGQYRAYAKVRCECGSEFKVPVAQIRMGEHLSCRRCAQKNRKYKNKILKKLNELIPDSKLRSLWTQRYRNIMEKCYNTSCKQYHQCGGRGIEIYEEWMEDRLKFLEYIKTLQNWENTAYDFCRINVNGNYEPGNVRLVTRKENINNRRVSIKIKYDGCKYTIREFKEKFTPEWTRSSILYHIKKDHTPEYMIYRYNIKHK